jgi:alkyl sulfatase BDS1-like metallo-beta-lactamase superfamily hydrolase
MLKCIERLSVWLTIIGLGLLFAAPLMAEDTEATKKLKERSVALREDIINVAEGVYTSVGHSVSTVSMIIGTDGLIIIDTGQAIDQAQKILAEFRKISDKPIKTIIITHGHGDHTGGAKVFIGDGKPDIWARENFGSEGTAISGARLNLQLRGNRQAGFNLPPEKRINNGIAPAMYPMGRPGERPAQQSQAGTVFNPEASFKPNKIFTGNRQRIETAGVTLELVAAPGETDDQLYVWMPEKKIAFSGDNFYASFPNLYAIRGTPYRDVRSWADANDMMLKEGPEALVPGHTRPILGKETVAQALADYRDAIRFVFNKTIEGMNKGMTPDELVDYVKLPTNLAEKDYLGEYYGSVAWSVRSIFNGYVGWFDGNPTNLHRFNPQDEAKRMSSLAGGQEMLLKQAQSALGSGDFQWAAQLSDYLLALDKRAVSPREIKAQALEALAERQMNVLGRNYCLTVAQELRKEMESLKK